MALRMGGVGALPLFFSKALGRTVNLCLAWRLMGLGNCKRRKHVYGLRTPCWDDSSIWHMAQVYKFHGSFGPPGSLGTGLNHKSGAMYAYGA